jgi:urease accessory protein UreF
MSLSPTVDPMAAQMAQLLAESDLDELREIVKRWTAEAPTQGQRRMYENFGARLVELKHMLAEAPVQPSREDLESALTMMLRLAAQHPSGAR